MHATCHMVPCGHGFGRWWLLLEEARPKMIVRHDNACHLASVARPAAILQTGIVQTIVGRFRSYGLNSVAGDPSPLKAGVGAAD